MDAANPSDVPSSFAAVPTDGAITSLLKLDRFGLTLGSMLALALTFWILRTMNIPAVMYRAGSVLQQPGWIVVMATLWVCIALSAIVTTVVASRTHYDGGLFCACVALAGVSSHFGTIRYALIAAGGNGIYLALAVELILLYLPVMGVWFILHRMSTSHVLPAEHVLDESDPDEPLDQKLLATAAQTLLTMICMMIFCQSDAKRQTLASVFVSAYLGALIVHHFFISAQPSAWYWTGPLVVGLVGYIGQSFGGTDFQLGEATGFFAPMARPQPLDYASLGVAGAMMGYWTSQRWHRTRLELEEG